MEGTADIQHLRAEIWQEFERRNAVYMNQHLSILYNLKLSHHQFHQEINTIQLSLQHNLDLYRDLYLEFIQVRKDVSALMQYCSRRGENGETTASASSPPGVQGSPPWQYFPIDALCPFQEPAQIQLPLDNTDPWDQYNQIEKEFPRFGSGDPTDWIFQCELCFRYYCVDESDFVMIASLHLDEPASSWFRCQINQIWSHDWASFKTELFRRFVDVNRFAKRVGIRMSPAVAGG